MRDNLGYDKKAQQNETTLLCPRRNKRQTYRLADKKIEEKTLGKVGINVSRAKTRRFSVRLTAIFFYFPRSIV